MIRVLIVTAWDGASGLFTVVRSLAERLAPAGVTFAAFSFDGWAADTAWAGCCSTLFSNRSTNLAEVLVNHHFDIVHLVDTACGRPYDPNVWLRRARFRGGVICNAHNTISVVPPDQMADEFIACSEPARAVMAETVKRPIRVITNGVDTDVFREQAVTVPRRPILGWVGRAADYAQKDIHGFLYLAASLGDRYDFAVASVDALPAGLRLRDWFGERVRFEVGLSRPELARFYSEVGQSGGALIATSVFEAFHLALAEAAACRCPIIAPRVIGLHWLEQDGVGLAFDRVDGIQGVKACLEKLADETFRQPLIDRAEKTVRSKYSSARMAEEYHQSYKDVLARREGSPGKSWPEKLAARIWVILLDVRRRTRGAGVPAS